MLKIDDLSKHFGGLVAVDELSIELRQGELLSIIGPNGAGKTTVFNLITGLTSPTSGEIFFKNREIVGLKPSEIAKRGISRTFQGIRLFRKMTVLENLVAVQYCRTKAGTLDALFNSARARREMRQMTNRALDLLEFVGLRQSRNLIAESLPYGERRLLEIARALMIEPDLILLDEPAAGMNEIEIGEMIDFIDKLRKTDVTIILVEHQMGLVMDISDRICVLNFGEKIAEGTPSEIRENAEVVEAYLGKDIQL